MRIRPGRSSDADALYDVCLRTGDGGADATGQFDDPRLIGEVYVGPYLALAPDLAFVAEDADGVAGYVLGAMDSRAFEAACDARWWPALRDRYADPGELPPYGAGAWTADQRMAHLVHHPQRAPQELVTEYPSHLHIDLLPRAQGQGVGRTLLATLFAELTRRGSPGIHLGVGRRNTAAIGFYRAQGFVKLCDNAEALFMGRRLP